MVRGKRRAAKLAKLGSLIKLVAKELRLDDREIALAMRCNLYTAQAYRSGMGIINTADQIERAEALGMLLSLAKERVGKRGDLGSWIREFDFELQLEPIRLLRTDQGLYKLVTRLQLIGSVPSPAEHQLSVRQRDYPLFRADQGAVQGSQLELNSEDSERPSSPDDSDDAPGREGEPPGFWDGYEADGTIEQREFDGALPYRDKTNDSQETASRTDAVRSKCNTRTTITSLSSDDATSVGFSAFLAEGVAAAASIVSAVLNWVAGCNRS